MCFPTLVSPRVQRSFAFEQPIERAAVKESFRRVFRRRSCVLGCTKSISTFTRSARILRRFNLCTNAVLLFAPRSYFRTPVCEAIPRLFNISQADTQGQHKTSQGTDARRVIHSINRCKKKDRNFMRPTGRPGIWLQSQFGDGG